MAELALEHVGKVYRNGYEAIHDFSLEIKEGEFLILVGPSGCGKSTLLRMIAGLEDISSGELWVDGEIENYKEPRERNLAMVFQNLCAVSQYERVRQYRIFPEREEGR